MPSDSEIIKAETLFKTFYNTLFGWLVTGFAAGAMAWASWVSYTLNTLAETIHQKVDRTEVEKIVADKETYPRDSKLIESELKHLADTLRETNHKLNSVELKMDALKADIAKISK